MFVPGVDALGYHRLLLQPVRRSRQRFCWRVEVYSGSRHANKTSWDCVPWLRQQPGLPCSDLTAVGYRGSASQRPTTEARHSCDFLINLGLNRRFISPGFTPGARLGILDSDPPRAFIAPFVEARDACRFVVSAPWGIHCWFPMS